MHSRAAGVLVVLSFMVPLAWTQEMEPQRERFGQGGQSRDRGTTEVVSLEPQMVAVDSGMVRVDILYRIRYDFFVFSNDMSGSPQPYRAHGDMLIELIDSTETSVSRKVQAISLESTNNEIAILRQQYYQGSASFVVNPGRFTAIYRAEDKESRREYSDRREVLRVPPFREKAVALSTMLFVEPSEKPSTQHDFTALNFGNSANFAKNTGVLFTIPGADTSLTIRYSLTHMSGEGREREIVQRDTVVPASIVRYAVPFLEPAETKDVLYALGSSPTFSTVYFTLGTARLRQGRYLAEIHMTARETTTVVKEFSIRWVDMPLSLFDLDFAVTAMKYITTEDEYDNLRSGNRANRIRKFEEYWAKKDPTPETAYNEVMTEYFRRVDYAFLNFRTLKEENGVLSDRGKIYILNGKPSNINRVLAPGGPPREIWTYASPAKQFIFEDPSRQGNYKLILTGNK